MGKRILIGSILVLVMLLLMPSIPAVQQKTIEEGFKQELQEKLDEINLDDLKDIEVLDWIRHPILYLIVTSIISFRLNNFIKLRDYSATMHIDVNGFISWDIEYPFLFLLSMRIALKCIIRVIFWDTISDTLGWNWDI